MRDMALINLTFACPVQCPFVKNVNNKTIINVIMMDVKKAFILILQAKFASPAGIIYFAKLVQINIFLVVKLLRLMVNIIGIVIILVIKILH